MTPAEHEAKKAELRAHTLPFDQYPEDYGMLAKLVGKFGKDIRFKRSAETRAGAKKIARQRKLILGPDVDLDNDGYNDVVLYDYDGKPVVYNGYELVKSESPYRKEFRTRFPTKVDRAEIGGFEGFKDVFWSNPEQASAIVAKLDDRFAKWASPAEKEAKRAKRKVSIYDLFKKDFLPTVQQFINSVSADKQHMKSIIPVFSLMPLLYINTVLRALWDDPENAAVVEEIKRACVGEKRLVTAQRYDMFKEYIRKNNEIATSQYKRYVDGIKALINLHASDKNVILKYVTKYMELIDPKSGFLTDVQIMSLKYDHSVEAQKKLRDLKIEKIRAADDYKEYLERQKNNAIETTFGDYAVGENVDIEDYENTAYRADLHEMIREYGEKSHQERVAFIKQILRIKPKIVFDMIKHIESFREDEVPQYIKDFRVTLYNLLDEEGYI